MKKKTIIKIIIDILMLIIMLLEYSRIYTGQLLHEVFGIILLLLFFIHNILNINFYKELLKGKYDLLRSIITIINIGFLICMLLTILLGIPISNEIFKNLNLNGNMTVRKLHTIFGYWGLIFLALHLGLHFKIIFTKLVQIIIKNKILNSLIYLLQILIVILGIKFMTDVKLWEHLIGELSFGSYDGNVITSTMKNLIIVLSISIITSSIVKGFYVKAQSCCIQMAASSGMASMEQLTWADFLP